MSKYQLTNLAVEDLTNIWNYTYDQWSEHQADKYYKELIEECSRISKNPGIGKKYFDLILGLRGAKINKHIIFYREIAEDEIEVERVLHERMDLKSKFSE